MTITIKNHTIDLPDLPVVSRDQYNDCIDYFVKFNELPITQAEKDSLVITNFPLFAAIGLQPMIKGKYSFDEAIELWEALKDHPDKQTVANFGAMFIFSIGNYFLGLSQEEKIESINERILKNYNIQSIN